MAVANEAAAKIVCTGCGKTGPWKPEFAGKKIKCKCGTIITVSATAPTAGRPAAPAAAAAPSSAAAKAARAGAPSGAPAASTSSASSRPAAPTGGRPGAPISRSAPPAAASRPAPAPAQDAGLDPAPLADLSDLAEPEVVNEPVEPDDLYKMQEDAAPKKAKKPAAAAAAVPAAGASTASRMSAGGRIIPGRMRRPPTMNLADAESQVQKVVVGVVLLCILIVAGAAAVVHFAEPSESVAAARGAASGEDEFTDKGQDPQVQGFMDDEANDEALHWLHEDSSRTFGGMTPHQAEGRINELYADGAKKVVAFGSRLSMKMAIQLPDEPAKRAKIFEWEKSYDERHVTAPQADVGQKWLLVNISMGEQ